MTESLSIHEARKLVLLSQQLPPGKSTGSSKAATLSAIEQLGYIQIDTISVIQRAHHHTLWNRNPRYQLSELDELQEDKKVFEYWSHAAAYLPFRDYRFTLPRKQAIASGELEHWFDRDQIMEKKVLQRIADEGPLMAKDFEHTGRKTGDWKSKPAKRALENLFMQGDLMSPRRVNFQKVYDLAERVLPEGTNTTAPTPREHARFLILRYLRANGIGQSSEIVYLLKGAKSLVEEVMEEMVLEGELIPIRIGKNETFHAQPECLNLLSQPLARSKLKILSPFDNLVIQRNRLRTLFGFEYQIECYLPAAKRRYGYFSLPILWDGKLAARMDCKAERKESILHIHHLALESWVVKTDSFIRALLNELKVFVRFNDCNDVRVHRTSPAGVKRALQASIQKCHF